MGQSVPAIFWQLVALLPWCMARPIQESLTQHFLPTGRVVAATSVPEGAGELDITLVLADGADTGRVDPAFAAHEDP